MRIAERSLLIGFAAVWLFTIVMRIVGLDRPTPRWVYVDAPGAGEYPAVAGFMNDTAAVRSSLLVGDTILRVGDRDVAGQDQLDLVLTVADVSWGAAEAVPFTVVREGVDQIVQEPRPRGLTALYIGDLVTSIAWGLTGILIILRAPPTRESRFVVACLAVYALSGSATLDGPAWVTALSLALNAFVGVTAAPLLLLAFMAIPVNAHALAGWNRVWPWLVAAPLGIPDYSLAYGFPLSPATAQVMISPLIAVFILLLLITLTVCYRKSGEAGRRQVKWIIFTVYIGSLISFLNISLAGWEPPTPPTWLVVSDTIATLMFPLGIFIAVGRYELFDIDRLISSTVAYNVVILLVVGVGFIMLPPVTEVLAQGLAMDPTVGRSSVALALAVVVIGAARRLGPRVDQVFFRERFALDDAIRSLPEKLAGARGPEKLWEMTGRELTGSLRPRNCVIFAAAGEAYVPVFTSGAIAPPAVPTAAPFVSWVGSIGAAFKLDARTSDRGAAVLDSVGAQVAIPVRRDGRLEAFITLGEKHSGDIYTRTDLSLLTALAHSLSIHLLRFTDTELLERTKTIQERMRRYVPSVVAEEIELGHELELGERDASVLFVDLRGFTARSEHHEALGVFSTVNRYSEAAAAIVHDAGGVVVDVWGDGMMAVFGAPRPLAGKEKAAVLAARRLADEIPKLPVVALDDPPFAVGVGVATGLVFIGNIRAAGRVIWSALGNPTILADRLQKATKDPALGARVLIDAATYTQAGDACLGFERQDNVYIPGREARETLYALTGK